MKHKLIIMFAVLLCAIANASAQDASFFRKYADKGDVEAMFNLANCYTRGTGGVNQDYSLATMWLTKAAKKKYAPAQVSLAYHYIYGIGVLKALQASIRTCQQGHEAKQCVCILPDESDVQRWTICQQKRCGILANA